MRHYFEPERVSVSSAKGCHTSAVAFYERRDRSREGRTHEAGRNTRMDDHLRLQAIEALDEYDRTEERGWLHLARFLAALDRRAP